MKQCTIRRITIALAATLSVLTASSTHGQPATAAPPAHGPAQKQIEKHLREHPGGRQISATEISYADRKAVITFTPAIGALAGADCPAGSYCFYEKINYGYPRLQLFSCGWSDLAWWGWQDRTESVHFNEPTGYLTLMNHGVYPGHTYDTQLFRFSTAYRTDPDLYPHGNKVDHANHYC